MLFSPHNSSHYRVSFATAILQIKELEYFLESVSENENKAQSLNSWLEAQSNRLKLMKKPASFILAQKRMEDCKVKTVFPGNSDSA